MGQHILDETQIRERLEKAERERDWMRAAVEEALKLMATRPVNRGWLESWRERVTAYLESM